MEAPIQVGLTHGQLERLIKLAKKGTMCKWDRDLIDYLEYLKEQYEDKYNPPKMENEIDLDEIPF